MKNVRLSFQFYGTIESQMFKGDYSSIDEKIIESCGLDETERCRMSSYYFYDVNGKSEYPSRLVATYDRLNIIVDVNDDRYRSIIVIVAPHSLKKKEMLASLQNYSGVQVENKTHVRVSSISDILIQLSVRARQIYQVKKEPKDNILPFYDVPTHTNETRELLIMRNIKDFQ